MVAPQTLQDTDGPPTFGFRDEDLYKCVHCGLCLNVCPTYEKLGLETESPRGRIALMKALCEGRVGLTTRVVSHMELCVQCRACEAACPSGVPFGPLLGAVRVQIVRQKKEPLLRRTILHFVFHHILPYPGRLYLLGGLLRFYQHSPLSWLLQRLPGRLGQLQKHLPPLPSVFFRPSVDSMKPQGMVRARVGLLSGCVMPLAQAATMEATVRVLTRNGCEVVVPPTQGCCGALNLHFGDVVQAQRMARRNIDAFLEAVGSERNKRFEGMRLPEFAEAVGKDTFVACCDLLVEERLRVAVVGWPIGDEDHRLILKHPLCLIGSDGIPAGGARHPRACGSHARYVGHYARELGLFPLEEAIRRITSAPARRFGLDGRGLIAEGMAADIAVFDPQAIIDRATYDEPLLLAEGVHHVLVNGRLVLRDGELTDARPGRALR